ncbi:hypothetical protein [Persicobacter sp. CCB-QB2]|uniref:hypothetical protein n=1 Tax=Persicobacter sp. CCB-QB2 TaxID=1561025 RepID=UPI0006A958AE|nr:hypothetical protein [Persicobacter sp. CCB-QB2]
MKATHKKYFDKHPKVKKFYFTTDGMAFQRENPAIQHQLNLTKSADDVEVVNRPKESKDKTPQQKAQATKLTNKLEELNNSLLEAQGDEQRQAIENEIKETEQKLEKLK